MVGEITNQPKTTTTVKKKETLSGNRDGAIVDMQPAAPCRTAFVVKIMSISSSWPPFFTAVKPPAFSSFFFASSVCMYYTLTSIRWSFGRRYLNCPIAGAKLFSGRDDTIFSRQSDATRTMFHENKECYFPQG
ncbi:unnamed protein product [Pylaiella littoralis]